MNFQKIAQEVLTIEAQELISCASSIENEIAQAVELISKIRGKLIITGVGKSGLVASKMAATFASTGTSSFFLHPTEAMHGDLGMIGKDDVLLAISYSGESEELTRMLPHIKRFDIPLIAMARSKDSTLGKYSDVFISIDVSKEACPLNIAPTSSTTLTMALGDALAVCMMKKRDFQKEDFASYHPGGSLGKMLFVKIKDLMKKDNLPVVNENTILKDAILKMSEGRMGNIVIVDNDERIVALLSDGDLRRALMRDNFSLDSKAIEYASRSPKFIDNDEILASDALKMIEENKMQLLVISDKNRRLKGLLHIHDLVEAGIK